MVTVAFVGSLANAEEQEQFDDYLDNFDSEPLPDLAKQVIAFAGGGCVTAFKPAGIPLRLLEEVALSVEELEAFRLKDLEGLEQEECA